MNKDEALAEIFGNDPLGLLTIKRKNSATITPDERLLNSFHEITEFYKTNGREPKPNIQNVSEYQLYSRLKNLKEDREKAKVLESIDKYRLLEGEKKVINSIDDILSSDTLDILKDDDTGLFIFEHTPKDFEKAEADFIARREKCSDFENYENNFKHVQSDLSSGKRKLIQFKEDNLNPREYYVHNGIHVS